MKTPGRAFDMKEMEKRRQASGASYLSFLKTPALHMGVYALPAGGVDQQSPHDEDEVYYVVSGKAKLRVDAQDYTAQPGAILYVAAHAKHQFHDIEEPLELLVFFSSAKPAPDAAR